MNEQGTDSLSYLSNAMQSASLKKKEFEADGMDTGESLSKNAVVEALVNNQELYGAFLRANTAKSELLESMHRTNMYDKLVTIDAVIGNIGISFSEELEWLAAREWKMPITTEENTKTISPGATTRIARSMGTNVFDYTSGAELRVNLQSQPTGNPILEGSYKTPVGDHFNLKRLSIDDERAKHIFLQVMEQRLSSLVVQATLTHNVSKLEELTAKLVEIKRDSLREI